MNERRATYLLQVFGNSPHAINMWKEYRTSEAALMQGARRTHNTRWTWRVFYVSTNDLDVNDTCITCIASNVGTRSGDN